MFISYKVKSLHDYMTAEKILVIGACGQLGTELVEALRGIYGDTNVVASDVKKE